MPDTKIAPSLLLEKIKKLPQYSHFELRNVERFLKIRANDPRAEWHVARLNGIGGSEIGILVAAHRGIDDAFGELPATLIREKLLAIPPQKTTLAMRKGIISEDAIRIIFCEDYKAERDVAIFNNMTEGKYKGQRDWIRYSPDDIVIIKGRRYLVDYKRPSEASLHKDILFRYVCQLHLGRMILENNGIEVEGILLAQFPESGEGDDLIVSEILHDETIDADILEAGDAAWGMIMAGIMPPYPSRDGEKVLPEQVKEAVDNLSIDFVRVKAMIDALDKRKDAIQKKISDSLSLYGVNIASQFTGINVSVSERINDTAIKVALSSVGDDAKEALIPVYSSELLENYVKQTHPEIDMGQFETGEFVPDKEKLSSLLALREKTLDQFAVRSFTMRVKTNANYKESIASMTLKMLDKTPAPTESDLSTAKTKAKKKGAQVEEQFVNTEDVVDKKISPKN